MPSTSSQATPRIVKTVAELRAACDAARTGARVGFVPTMGALHAGHLALVREAFNHAGFVVVSIFVNPTQFGPSEDLSRYPRDLQGDVAKLGAVGASLVFAPEPGAMYAPGDDTRVRVGGVAGPLEGERRPGHFEGVATVVTKLFAAVGPCTTVFGRKDYQQLLVVRRLVRDLLLPVELIGHPIVRERDGLAMSSRNAYLSNDERARALSIVRGLDAASRAFAAGERRRVEIEGLARASIEASVTSIDYVEARDADGLQALGDILGERAALLVACRVGATRLIDNVVLGEDPAPLGA
jgi:pantoate--beta-alanine ligase